MNEEKLSNLKKYLKSLNSVIVAYSGGVDSTFLLKIAHQTLSDKVIAVTVASNSFSKRELKQTKEFCKKENIKQIILPFDEFKIEGFKSNPKERCYICKKCIFENIKKIAQKENIKYILEGSNADDLNDYRPGMRALRELDILSPLMKFDLAKDDIRLLSKKLNLPTATKPSMACLSTRICYGEEITKQKLEMVEAAEDLLYDLNFSQYRVRFHNFIARIEVYPFEFEKLIENRKTIIAEFKKLGFRFVTLDIEGFRSGSMNEDILKH